MHNDSTKNNGYTNVIYIMSSNLHHYVRRGHMHNKNQMFFSRFYMVSKRRLLDRKMNKFVI